MIGRIRSRLSSAHLIAGVALAFAIGGGTALALPGVNQVNSGDVKNGTLRGADVKNNSLTGADVRGLTGADINESTLNITVPTPPTPQIQTLNQRLGPNQTVTLTAGSFTVTSSSDAAGLCEVTEFTASEAGEIDFSDIDAGETINWFSGQNNDFVIAQTDDGNGGASFGLEANEFNGRCNVALHGLAL